MHPRVLRMPASLELAQISLLAASSSLCFESSLSASPAVSSVAEPLDHDLSYSCRDLSQRDLGTFAEVMD